MVKKYLTKDEIVIACSNSIENISVVANDMLLVNRNTPPKEIAERYARAMRYLESIKVLSQYIVKMFCTHDFEFSECKDNFDWMCCKKCFTEAKTFCTSTTRENAALESIFSVVK